MLAIANRAAELRCLFAIALRLIASAADLIAYASMITMLSSHDWEAQPYQLLTHASTSRPLPLCHRLSSSASFPATYWFTSYVTHRPLLLRLPRFHSLFTLLRLPRSSMMPFFLLNKPTHHFHFPTNTLYYALFILRWLSPRYAPASWCKRHFDISSSFFLSRHTSMHLRERVEECWLVDSSFSITRAAYFVNKIHADASRHSFHAARLPIVFLPPGLLKI